MFRMAIGTGGRLAVTGRNRFAMDTFAHILGRLFMAAAAGLRQPREMKRRLRRSRRQNRVAIMTVTAGGGVLLPARQSQAVNTCSVGLELFFMTSSAIGRSCRDIVVRMLVGNIGMATCTGIGFMHRSGKPCLIDKKQHLFPGGVGFGERLVRMTVQAGAVLNLLGAKCRERQSRQGQDNNGNPGSFCSETHTVKDRSSRASLLYLLWRFFCIFCAYAQPAAAS